MIRVVAMSVCLAMGFAGHAMAQGAAKADPAKGQTIAAQVCVACHMADGNSAQPENPTICTSS